MKFDYQPNACDVRAKQRLRKYREKLTLWYEWMSGDSEHSIWKQIYIMLWNDAVYRMFNDAKGIAANHPSAAVGFNSPVSRFMDQGYVATQLLAIRRLVEKNERDDAISLRRLLRDMKANCDLLTREIYVSHDGLPYDPAPGKAEFFREIVDGKRETCGRMETKGPKAWAASQRAHRSFDKLSGATVKPKRNDRIDSKILDKLSSQLGACSGMTTIASAFIAHAADASRRNQITPAERSVTLEKISLAQKAICRVASYVYGPILYIGGSSLLPTPQYNFMESLDKPWITSENIPLLRQCWEKHRKKVESWVEGDWIKEMKLPG